MALAKKLKIKPVKVQIVDAVNKVFDLDLDYFENDEADAVALCMALLFKIKKGEID